MSERKPRTSSRLILVRSDSRAEFATMRSAVHELEVSAAPDEVWMICKVVKELKGKQENLVVMEEI